MVECDNSGEGERSIHLQIDELLHRRLNETSSATFSTMFEPQSSIEKRDSSAAASVASPTAQPVPAPEKKLTLFALRLAVLEKVATGLGTLGFIWATVVLLGGFAIELDQTDFWFITIILLIEGTRIFSRSHELEWQHQATWSITDAGINSFRALQISSSSVIHNIRAVFRPVQNLALRKQSQHSRDIARTNDNSVFSRNSDLQGKIDRTWTSSEVPLLPYAHRFFCAKHISKLLYWLQLLSASSCVALSLVKLVNHNYGEVEKGNTNKSNRQFALSIFYSLALAEALLFLMEKAYSEFMISCCKLLEEVNKECDLGPSGMVSIRRFFYDAYSRCVNGSIFDGLQMDMVTFGMDLLGSKSTDEQLIGAKILRQFSMNRRYSDDTLQKIGINIAVIERLVEILNWTDQEEEEIRRSAAEILSKLAGKKQNSIRVAGVPGAMESISSLLQTCRSSSGPADEISEKRIISDHANYGFLTFNHLGLLILKKLARVHDNCGKIGNTRGLLPKIIDFTHADERILKDVTVMPNDQILTLKRSLQLVKRLASTTGNTGKNLRRNLSEIVFTISNIRDILRYGEKQPVLQQLGIEILTSLALEEEATERVGGTGGVLKELFKIFFNKGMLKNDKVRIKAGEALAMLVLESTNNCQRIFKLGVLESLIEALEVRLVSVHAARILRNLCTYNGSNCFHQLKGITNAVPTVLRAITSEEHKLQEAMVGLAAPVLAFLSPEESSLMFKKAEITEAEVANELVQILKRYRHPPIKVPRIRRFAIELAIWMMRNKPENVQIFRTLEMEKELDFVLDTTAELESFSIFSGTVGMSRHSTTIHSLVETALGLLAEG
ncbi:uncharacterized protein LOC103932103 [Pyrus x bretschneideri]|uniref:uncharacterized protein LOC103932103 n=1 Tax=Pyrus x bretschneideri TaxID=225117 RepID=UPI00202FB49A|nr:uncharacterized protein LOC103932103 [Pyrus x bretschneideri]